jgi:ankyrin repeat protein
MQSTSSQLHEAMASPEMEKIISNVSIERQHDDLMKGSTTTISPPKQVTPRRTGQTKYQEQQDGMYPPIHVTRGATSEFGGEEGLVENNDFDDTKSAPWSRSATKPPSECNREIHEIDESFAHFICSDGDNANTNNAARNAGSPHQISVASPTQDKPGGFPVVNSPRFSQIRRKTKDSNHEKFDPDFIDEATNAAIYQIMMEDMNQLGSNHCCDNVSCDDAMRTISATGDMEPPQKESLSSVFSVETVHELYRQCMETKPDENGVTDPSKWESVRNCLFSSCDLVQTAARIQSPGGLTPFHQICRHNPPLDIVELFVAHAGFEVMSFTDKGGMLPLHYACLHNTSVNVIEALVQLYPEGRLKQDAKGETPLHYAVTNMSLSVDAIDKVCIKDAAGAADQRGMLPFHYAIMHKAYFNPSTIKVLINAFPEGLTCPDRKGRIPIRSLVKSCHLPETLELLEFAFALDPALCKGDIGLMLLKNLGDCARRVGKSNNIQTLLKLLLEYNPEPSDSFLTALKDLPRWLNKGDKYEKKSVFQRFMPRKRNIL